MKTKRITLSGGFHNSRNIRVQVPADFHPATDRLIDVLSETTIERLNRHFCGIRGCTCGGLQRANVEALNV